MRRFTSYGPINTKLHYYAPKKELIERAYTQLMGENPLEGGHYITVWAPRQCGKTWIMQQVLQQIEKTGQIDVVKVDLEHLEDEPDVDIIASSIAEDIFKELGKKNPGIDTLMKFQELFTRDVLEKPIILILDEFDALTEKAINKITRVFRNIYNRRQNELRKLPGERRYLLYGLALVGVRSVLGIENVKGSPFNVQRSLHIPNLTYNEVNGMFRWYEKESEQMVESEVINRLFYETQGQPGLTCWFGELLTEGFEGYSVDKTRPIRMQEFERIFRAAVDRLPNNNILNIISKANQELYKHTVMELFKTDQLVEFKFDNKKINFLYMNGVIEPDIKENEECYVKFASPFVQKRLFNYFSDELFRDMGRVVEPFDDLKDSVTDESINIKNILERYKKYLLKNSHWLFKDAPRRKDLHILEAVFHFNLYMYLHQLLRSFEARVFPEFPTGNGKIDLVIHYKGRVYGIELKTFRDVTSYKKALSRAAEYGKQLDLKEIVLVFFIESIDENNRKKWEVDWDDEVTGITVMPIFIETGNP
jgi:hypothetical protein